MATDMILMMMMMMMTTTMTTTMMMMGLGLGQNACEHERSSKKYPAQLTLDNGGSKRA